jgi:hypothetical protein
MQNRPGGGLAARRQACFATYFIVMESKDQITSYS